MKAMSKDKKFVVVAYDIVKNKTRTKLMKLLKGHGDHTQKSVFECLLSDEQITFLKKRIRLLINPDEATVRLYILTNAEVKRICIIGLGVVYEERQLTLI